MQASVVSTLPRKVGCEPNAGRTRRRWVRTFSSPCGQTAPHNLVASCSFTRQCACTDAGGARVAGGVDVESDNGHACMASAAKGVTTRGENPTLARHIEYHPHELLPGGCSR